MYEDLQITSVLEEIYMTIRKKCKLISMFSDVEYIRALKYVGQWPEVLEHNERLEHIANKLAYLEKLQKVKIQEIRSH